jgi:large-conductance mechanosensitive channel
MNKKFLKQSFNFEKVIHFLKKKDLIYMSLAVYLGLVIQKLLESLVGDIIIPLVSYPIPKKLKKINIQILDLKINKFLTLFISSIIAIIVTYNFTKIII